LRIRADALVQSVWGLSNLLQANLRAKMSQVSFPAFASSLIRKWALWGPIAAIAVLLATRPARRRIAGWWRRMTCGRNTRMAAISYYLEALALLGAEGMKRGRAQTPMEFAQSIGTHPAGEPFISLTRMYNAARYGPPGTPFQRLEAQAFLRALRMALRSKSG
jgi:hypothetical protein